MPHLTVIGRLLRLPGFYAGPGNFFPSFTKAQTDEILSNILGHDNSYNEFDAMKDTFVRSMINLFVGANQISEVYIALRGHEAYYETLASAWDPMIVGEVSGDDVKALMMAFVAARRRYNSPTGTQANWELTECVDAWIGILDQARDLAPLQQATVTVQNAPTTVPDLATGLAAAPFALGGPNYDWPPGHFAPHDRALLLDPNVKVALAGVSTRDKQPEKRPDLPAANSTPSHTKLWLSYLALAGNSPDKSWGLFLLPIGPFKTNMDRAAWKPATGQLSRVCGTWDGFAKRAMDALQGGKKSVICLLTPWRGTPNQLITLGKTRNEQGMIWASQCPRQGLVLILHRITINGQNGYEYVLYDPTITSTRIREESWVKASLVHLFQYRQVLKERVDQLTGGQVLRGWIGGRRTGLPGAPDSVQMACDLIRDMASSSAQDPFDVTDGEWDQRGFTQMQGYKY